jgi:hypothetical protein
MTGGSLGEALDSEGGGGRPGIGAAAGVVGALGVDPSGGLADRIAVPPQKPPS